MGGSVNIELCLEFDSSFGEPLCEISVDRDVLYDGPAQQQLVLDWPEQVGKHMFTVRHYGKGMNDFDHQHDRHITIVRLRFDGIDLDQIHYRPLTHRAKFYPEYYPDYVISCQANGTELPEYLCPNHYLGHNGSWVLAFESPIMDWIIREQQPSGINLEDTIFSTGQETLNMIKDFFKL